MNTIINKQIPKNEQKKIICKNILLMNFNRNLIDESEIKTIFENIISKVNENNIFEFNIKDNKSVMVHFIDGKISSIKKIDNIDDIIVNNKINIFIISSIQSKIWEQLIKYNIEIFYMHELMINLVDHDIIPEHKLLTEEEKTEFLINYENNDDDNLPFIKVFDPVSRYYNAKVGDIFRIKRFSLTSGYSIFYRKVITSSIPDIEKYF